MIDAVLDGANEIMDEMLADRLEDNDGDEYIKWRVSVGGNSRIIFTFDDIVQSTQQPSSTPTSQPAQEQALQPSPAQFFGGFPYPL